MRWGTHGARGPLRVKSAQGEVGFEALVGETLAANGALHVHVTRVFVRPCAGNVELLGEDRFRLRLRLCFRNLGLNLNLGRNLGVTLQPLALTA